MTDTIGPFDNAPWSQDAWYRHAPKWASSGVNGTPASSTTTGDLPITFSGLNFTIGVGRGWVRGAGFERSGTPASQAIAANTNASLFRRDRVVLRRDLAAKTVAPTLILGTASASPTAPAIQQNETGQWDLPLFSFLVPPNSGTSITGIVDERLWLDASSGDMSAQTKAQLDAMAAAGITFVAGKRIYTTSDGRYWRYDTTSSSWKYAGGSNPPIAAVTPGVGWSTAARAAGCYLDSSGIVHLIGAVFPTTTYNPQDGGPHTAFQLPTGYRPGTLVEALLSVPSPNLTIVLVEIRTDGIGYISAGNLSSIPSGSASTHFLDGISFHPGYAGSTPVS